MRVKGESNLDLNCNPTRTLTPSAPTRTLAIIPTLQPHALPHRHPHNSPLSVTLALTLTRSLPLALTLVHTPHPVAVASPVDTWEDPLTLTLTVTLTHSPLSRSPRDGGVSRGHAWEDPAHALLDPLVTGAQPLDWVILRVRFRVKVRVCVRVRARVRVKVRVSVRDEGAVESTRDRSSATRWGHT